MTPSFFTSSFYFSHCCFLSSSFENSKHSPPQLEHPKVAKTNNATQQPKITKTNNVTMHPKVAKANNATMSLLHISFLQFFGYPSCETQISTSFSFEFHLYTKDTKVIASHPFVN
jgi:hypothetical protein